MKLLWLSDRVHLNKYGRLILKDSYRALPHGPVPSATMDFTKSSNPDNFNVVGHDIKAEKEFDERYFSKSDIEVMNSIWEKFGNLNQFALRDLSHKFPEWQRFEKDLNIDYLPNSYSMVMEDFFVIPQDLIDEYKTIFYIENAVESLSHFRSYNEIQSNLDACH
ncbi:Panacea domain-containing protein [Flavobacterium sp. 22076]|uniref:Panacea domain-containing protein n=1 Tax=unclassified Flavobacterium TaxID=196869 RepID=UPI003F829F48